MFPLSSIPSAGRPMDRSKLFTRSGKEAPIQEAPIQEAPILGRIHRSFRVGYRFLIVQGMRVTGVITVGLQK